ncbi:MAG TPA: twin-arginine translocase TatA/TatE family subunit [Solirubrobacteraceae bacterium]|nr:twin-arginine translocase TatA/TatE family subunit [Solirubrobacteraceae bacterium]
MGIESPIHLLFIGVVALLVLGPRRLPELARRLGAGVREFRHAIDVGAEHRDAPPEQPAGPATATATEQPASPAATAPASQPASPATAPASQPASAAAAPASQPASAAAAAPPPQPVDPAVAALAEQPVPPAPGTLPLPPDTDGKSSPA